MYFVLTDLTIMDWRWHIAGHYNIGAEVFLNQVRMQRVRCMWCFISRTWKKNPNNCQLIVIYY